LVRTKVMEFAWGVSPEPDQDVSFSVPVPENSFIVGFFRILLVESDHESLSVSRFVRPKPVSAVPVKKDCPYRTGPGIQVAIPLDFEPDVFPRYGEENLGGDQFRSFPLDVVFVRSIENGEKALVVNIPVGISDQVSPLFPPIMLDGYFPFLLQRAGSRRERDLVQGDQILPQSLVADVLEKRAEGRFVKREDRALKERIEIVRFEGIEKLAPQCFHGMLFGLGMKDAAREERDNHHDFRNTRHVDKLGISYPSDKREDWKAD